jgi:acyl-CoA thioesterase
MFGFDGGVQGFRQIIYEIVDNRDGYKFTHKQVRAYARCLLVLVSSLNVSNDQQTQITLLLAAMSAKGLAHYDRSFLAQELLKILDKAIEEVDSKNNEYDASIF